jgi:tetratricopeptide (TPR) repeat protein
LLTSLDRVEAEFDRLEEGGVDLRAERVRWGNLTDRLRSHPALIARAAAPLPGGLAALRAKHAPAAAFWWHADEERDRRVRRALIETLAIVGGIIAVLIVGYQIVIRLFPPDPRAVALIQTSSAIDARIAEGDWPGALAVAEASFAEWPDDPELASWVAVLAEQTGDPARAAEATLIAQELLADDPVRFWLLQSELRQRTGDYQGGSAAADKALALAPDNPEATFMKGKAAMFLNDRETALIYLDRTYTLASESNPQLALNARVLWGELIQRAQLELPAGATSTLTPTSTP